MISFLFILGTTSEVLQQWAMSTVDLLIEQAMRPELFGLLVPLCKLGDKALMFKLKNSLRGLCSEFISACSLFRNSTRRLFLTLSPCCVFFSEDFEKKEVHRSGWNEVSSDVFHLLSWASIDLSLKERSVLVRKGCLTEAYARSLRPVG